jgi:hypothetical protein
MYLLGRAGASLWPIEDGCACGLGHKCTGTIGGTGIHQKNTIDNDGERSGLIQGRYKKMYNIIFEQADEQQL